MITQVNGINSSVSLSKSPQAKAQMSLSPITIPRDLAFTGKEKIVGDGKGLLSRGFSAMKKFVMETIPKYAKKAWHSVKGLFHKASDAEKGPKP